MSRTDLSAPATGAVAPGHRHRPGVTLAVIAFCQLMLVLDGTIVTVALPAIQRDLDFSPARLSWVLNAYVLAFGGLLLLGGRTGDILGRRRMLVTGIALFGGASLLGGLAATPGWLLAARSAQGVGAAIASPTALSLISTNFPEGSQRNRAFGAYAGASVSGSALGLILGGVLVSGASWRWVLLVNVPVALGLLVAVPRFIRESEPQPGRFDLPGAVTSTVGLFALVYGFIHAADEGWGNRTNLVAFLTAGTLLTCYALLERRARQPITPLHLFDSRNRVCAYLLMLLTSAAMLGMFFFLTQFVQEVLDYSALRTGLGFLPTTVMIVLAAQLATQLLPRTGPLAFLAAGGVLTTAGMLWLSQISTASGYLTGVLGPTLLLGSGIGLIYVPVALIAFLGVDRRHAGAASGLLDACQQGGAAVGLAVLVTVFGEASRRAADRPPAGADPVQRAHDVLVQGFGAAFAVGALFTACALVIVLAGVRVKASELDPAAAASRGA